MDLQLYFRVLWRFRLIMALGLVLASALAFFSFARVDFSHGSPKVTYRQNETFKATALVALTQRGFPNGYTVLPFNPEKLADGTTQLIPRYADTSRFTQLAILYAPFVRSDQFKALLRRRTSLQGLVDGQPVLDPAHQTALPYITVSGYATKTKNAIELANIASGVLADYVLQQQKANRIPPSERVITQVASRASAAIVTTSRKKTTPIVVFFTVMLAAIGLSFVLENLRPRVRSVATLEESDRVVAERRPA